MQQTEALCRRLHMVLAVRLSTGRGPNAANRSFVQALTLGPGHALDNYSRTQMQQTEALCRCLHLVLAVRLNMVVAAILAVMSLPLIFMEAWVE